jgi:hypothetical protein
MPNYGSKPVRAEKPDFGHKPKGNLYMESTWKNLKKIFFARISLNLVSFDSAINGESNDIYFLAVIATLGHMPASRLSSTLPR